MSQLFGLDAQKAGAERHVHADADGIGITVYCDGWPRPVRSTSDAIRIARDYIGEFLAPANRGGIPWGLRVTVSEGVAVYGEWPLVPSSERPSFRMTPISKIRSRYHGSDPISALENAIEIIKAYTPSRPRAAA